MSLLFESIRISRRAPLNLPYHQERVKRSQTRLFKVKTPISLKESIHLPSYLDDGEYKCRITYGQKIHKVEFSKYVPKKVSSLKLVFHDDVDYSFKFEDRQLLNTLYNQREACDDILIVKQGYLTDTSYSNIVFWNGEQWLSPTHCLLPGTQRAKLLREGTIRIEAIKVADLGNFAYAKLINAMLDWETAPTIPIQAIV